MSSYLTRLMHCIIVLTIVMAVMILYAMPDQEVEHVLNKTLLPTPAAVPIQTHVPTISQPISAPTAIDISVLSIYDRDGDGTLSKHERGVVEYDYLHKLLTAAQVECAVDVLGYVPSLSHAPTTATEITPAATPEITPTSSANESDVPANTTQIKFEAIEQWRADVEAGIKDNVIGGKVQEFVQWCVQMVSGIRVW